MKFKNPIADLSAQINKHKGIARANYFAITFSGPASVQPDTVSVNALCESVTLPGRSISTNEFAPVGGQIKRPYTFINDDVTLTFYVTNDFYIYRIFEKWMKHVVNDVSGFVGYRDQYAMPMTISQLDLNNNEIHQVMLHKAFPISMAITPLSVSDGALSKLTIVMTFDNFTTKGSNFEQVSSTADFGDALSIPNPNIASLPYSPFGDIPNQVEFDLDSVKQGIQTSLDDSLNSTINAIKENITSTVTSITSPISEGVKDILAGGNTGLGGITTPSTGVGFLDDIIGEVNTGITSITNRASTGLSNLIG
jgi:rRNA processing protein Gar1